MRQVGAGQGAKHAAGFGNAAIDGAHQLVDAAGQDVEFIIGKLRGHPAAEVTGNCRPDDLAKGILQLMHHLGALGPAPEPVDEAAIVDQFTHRNDEQALIANAKQVGADLEKIFEEDAKEGEAV